jgi:hypothetical protein
LKVTVPDGAAPPEREALTDEAATATPTVAVPGATTDSVGETAATTVSPIDPSHDEPDGLFWRAAC